MRALSVMMLQYDVLLTLHYLCYTDVFNTD